MALDNHFTPLHRMSDQVYHLANAAVDHLKTVHDLVIRLNHLRQYGNYGPIRAALESAALGVWLLESAKLDTRIMRSLKLVLDQQEKTEDVARKLGLERGDKLARVERRLNEIKDMRKGNRPNRIRPVAKTAKATPPPIVPKMTDIMLLVGPHVRQGDMWTPIEAWSSCSALTHGNQVTTHMLHELEPLRVIDDRFTEYRITASFSLTAALVETAHATLTHLLDLVERHSVPPPQGGYPIYDLNARFPA